MDEAVKLAQVEKCAQFLFYGDVTAQCHKTAEYESSSQQKVENTLKCSNSIIMLLLLTCTTSYCGFFSSICIYQNILPIYLFILLPINQPKPVCIWTVFKGVVQKYKF